MSKRTLVKVLSIITSIILPSLVNGQLTRSAYTLYNGSSWGVNYNNTMYFGQSDGTVYGPNTCYRTFQTQNNNGYYSTDVIIDSIYVSFAVKSAIGSNPMTVYFTDFMDDNVSYQERWNNVANGVKFDSIIVGGNDYFYKRTFTAESDFVIHFLNDVQDGEFEYSFYCPEAEALGSDGNRSYYILNSYINVYPFGPNINHGTNVVFKNVNEVQINIQGALEVNQSIVVPSGNSTYLTDGIQHSVQTMEPLLTYQNSDYQHHHWNTNEQEYYLEHSFDTRTYEQDALFDNIFAVDIQTSPANLSLDIHDPWYYDEATQTQPDDFRSVSSGQYQVFLNQNPFINDSIPIYRLKASDVVNADGIEWYFSHWEGTGVDIADPNELTTAMVFTVGGAVIKAIYKPHMHSYSAIATMNNNGSNSAYHDGKWNLVYTDNGKIFHTLSTDLGLSWNRESFVSNQFLDSQYKNPSVAVDYYHNGIPYVTFEGVDIGGNSTLRFVEWNGSEWDEIIWSWDQTLPWLDGDMLPAVTTDEDAGWYVVFRGSESGDIQPDGIKFLTNSNLSCDYTVIPIPETNGNSQKPSCVAMDSQTGEREVNFIWEENSEVFSKSSAINNYGIDWDDKESLSDVFPGAIYNRNPVSATDGFDVIVAWEARDWIEVRCPKPRAKTTSAMYAGCGYYVFPICIRKKTASGWGPLTKIIHGSSASKNPALSVVRSSSLGGDIKGSLVYKCGNSIFTRRLDDDNWSSATNLGLGNYPTVAAETSTNLVAYTKGGPALYEIETAAQLILVKTSEATFFDSTQYWREISLDIDKSDLIKTSEFKPTGNIKLAMSEAALQRPNSFTPLTNAPVMVDTIVMKETWFNTEPVLITGDIQALTFNLTTYTYDYAFDPSATSSDLPLIEFGLYSADENKVLLDEVYTLNFTDLPISQDTMAAQVIPIMIDVNGLAGQSVYLAALICDGNNDDAWQHSEVYLSPDGSESIKGYRSWVPVIPEVLPDRYALSKNYPNPFNPQTTIVYNLLERSNVHLAIYDILGRKVTNLFDGQKPGGIYHQIWNGKDNNGKAVSSGIYIYRLTAESLESAEKFHQDRKLILLK